MFNAAGSVLLQHNPSDKGLIGMIHPCPLGRDENYFFPNEPAPSSRRTGLTEGILKSQLGVRYPHEARKLVIHR